jgi:hypothetical protein
MKGKSSTLVGAALLILLALGIVTSVAAETTIGSGKHSPRATPVEPGPVAPSIDRRHAYFAVAPDLRLCPSPLCGGFWVTRVNRATTVCVDGSLAQSCYVADLDLSRLGLSVEQEAEVRGAAGHLLLRGAIEPAPSSLPIGNLGVLGVTEAWIGHAGITASGSFYRAQNTGIVCITFPCLSYEISPLNVPDVPQGIAGVELTGVKPDPQDGHAQMSQPNGLMVAGALSPVSGPAGGSFVLQASEYYLPVTPEFTACQSDNRRPCAQGEFCNLGGKAQCGRESQSGVCTLRPQACTAIFDPVCGCDGNTYSSACSAHAAGVGVDYTGACK